MTMEDFVTFEIAKKLKDLGFNIPFFFFYRTDDDDKFIHHAMVNNPLIYGESIDDEVVIAPTVSQVLKWLRDEKKLHIMIAIWKVDLNNTTYKWGYDIVNLTTTHVEGCDTQCANSFEEAALAGIEHVLDKELIKL